MKVAVQQCDENKASILRFVADFENECGCGPSVDWIVYALRMNPSTTFGYIHRLERDGMIVTSEYQDQEAGGGSGSRNIIHLYTTTAQARAVLEAQA